MSQNIDDIIEKAKKIKALADSEGQIGNEEAAKNFAATLQRLLTTYKLSMSDIEFTKHLETEKVETSSVKWREHNLPFKRKREAWVEVLASCVARAHGCRILVQTGCNIISLVGYESNRKVAEYVLVTLVRAANTIANYEYNKYYNECFKEGDVSLCHGFRASFLRGFTDRVNERLKEELERPAQPTPGASTSTALMVINRELVKVDEYMKKFTSRAAYVSGRRSDSSSEGYARGRSVANSMGLRGNAVERGNGGSTRQIR